MARRGEDDIVVRCTVSKAKHPRLHHALSEVAALERPKWLRLHATIGHALASNQSVLELLALTVADAKVTQGQSAPGSRPLLPDIDEGQDRPPDEYLDMLADAVLSRA